MPKIKNDKPKTPLSEIRKRTKQNRKKRITETAKKLSRDVDEVFRQKENQLAKLAKKMFESGSHERTVFTEVKKQIKLIVDFMGMSDEVTNIFATLLMKKMEPIIINIKLTTLKKGKRKILPETKYEKTFGHPRNGMQIRRPHTNEP